MLDLPPPLILPEHYRHPRPAIIRPAPADLLRPAGPAVEGIFPWATPMMAGNSPWNRILALARADGWDACWDVTNPSTRTLRSSGGVNYVTEIRDGLGNRPPFVQASTSLQFALTPGYFGKLDGLTGGSRYMVSTFGTTLSQPRTIVALSSLAAVGTQYVFDGIGTSNRNALLYNYPGQIEMFSGLSILRSSSGLVGTSKLYTGRYSSTSSSFRSNGTQVGLTGNPGSQSIQGLTLGARFNGIEMAMSSGILLMRSDSSLSEIERMEALLIELSGVT